MKKIVVFACLVLLGVTIQSCRKKGNPYAGIPASVLKDTTTIEILERSFNFDTINQDDTVVHIFKVKNTGEKNLIIGNAFGSCGCTVPEWPKEPVAPGAEATIRVKFNSAGKEGEQNKTVTLQVNTVSHSEQLLLNGFVRVPKKKNKIMNASIMLLFYGAIFAVIYFFFIRPQSQKIKEGKKFIDEVQKGDKVVTTGGIHGIIDAVEETTFLLRVDHIRMKVEKSAISAELTKAAQGTDTKA